MDSASRYPGIVTLATNALSQAADLVQTEVRLARAELGEKFAAVRGGAAFLVAGAIFLVAALFLFLQAAVAFLVASGIPAGWAMVLVAAASAGFGFILVKVGQGRLAGVDVTPERTIDQLEQDLRLAREKVS